MNDLLQKDKFQHDELKEEINLSKLEIEKLNKKIHQYEKDTNYLNMSIQQLEIEVSVVYTYQCNFRMSKYVS